MASARDDNGWLERWGPLARRVTRYMYRRFHTTETPYEAMLDACLLTAWKLDQFEPPEAYMAHRMRLAIIDELRRNTWGVRHGQKFRAHPMAPLMEGAARFAHDDPDPTLRMDLERALRLLPKRERQIIRHRDLEGNPQHAIAERLGVSPERVSQLRTRGLARLRELMHENAPVRKKRKR